MNKILVFDIWADYGHFRVPYTTSSPITYPIPPKTAIYGLLGAILGIEKTRDDQNAYLKYFQEEIRVTEDKKDKQQWRVSVAIKSPVKTVHIPENFINTKEARFFARMPRNKPCRTQINMEFLKDPVYRIYITSNNYNKLLELDSNLSRHKTAFTLSLGLSECLANFEYIGFFDFEERTANEEYVEISSIIPIKLSENSYQIDFSVKNSKFLKIHIPLEMKPDRELTKTGYFLIEANANKIKYKNNKYFHIHELNENICLF